MPEATTAAITASSNRPCCDIRRQPKCLTEQEDGVKEYKSANGAALRRLGENEFEIESSGVKITVA